MSFDYRLLNSASMSNSFCYPRQILFILCIAFIGCQNAQQPVEDIPSQRTQRVARNGLINKYVSSPEYAQVERSEELLLSLNSHLKTLSREAANLSLPGFGFDAFSPRVDVTKITSNRSLESLSIPAVNLTRFQYQAASDTSNVERTCLQIWQDLFEKIDFFEHNKFYFVRGDFHSDKENEWVSVVGFTGVARLKTGEVAAIEGKIDVIWKQEDDASESQWSIHSWSTNSLEMLMAPRKMFRDVLPVVVSDPRTTSQIADSSVKRGIQGLIEEGRRCNSFSTVGLRNGFVSVLDFDEDGWDDVAFTFRDGTITILLNQQNGQFDVVSRKLKSESLPEFLQINVTCFCDVDNDGDADVVVGCVNHSSILFENVDGEWVERQILPVDHVTSISVADYNMDGLLDIYCATYQWKLTNEPALRGSTSLPELLDRRTSVNVLLTNVGGGKFENLHENDATTAINRSTFHGGWADYDKDGDPDLYLSNDFAPNNMLRNEGESFVDVTERTQTADVGFGMGVSWGDFDNDADLDLYVTNMFSKAGQRITAKLPQLQAEWTNAARGNSLFRNNDALFEKVSGAKPPALCVEKAGWSWCGQFADINNDGFLDIHSLSGFYTPPAKFEYPEDL